VKDKIEAQNEVKVKEQEEKDVVAQQVIILCCAVSSLSVQKCLLLINPLLSHPSSSTFSTD